MDEKAKDSPRISIIAAISKTHRGLGMKNQLLWKLTGDLPRFKALTMGRPVIMGRKTFDSIGRPLPGRRNLIVSRNTDLSVPGAETYQSLAGALARAAEDGGEIFVIGGAEIYRAALPLTDRLYLSIVESEPPADAFFPEYQGAFRMVTEEPCPDSNPPYVFTVWERSSEAARGIIT